MADAYLAIPLLFTRATTPSYSTLDRNVTFKDGFTSIINTVNVQLSNNGQVSIFYNKIIYNKIIYIHH